MRECEFLSIDKYEKNIENYSTQLKYECSVFVVFLFFYSCFVFLFGVGFWLWSIFPCWTLKRARKNVGNTLWVMGTLCLSLLLRFSFFDFFRLSFN